MLEIKFGSSNSAQEAVFSIVVSNNDETVYCYPQDKEKLYDLLVAINNLDKEEMDFLKEVLC